MKKVSGEQAAAMRKVMFGDNKSDSCGPGRIGG